MDSDPGQVLVFYASSGYLLYTVHRCLSSVCAVAGMPRFLILVMSAVERVDDDELRCLRALHERCRNGRCALLLAGLTSAALDDIQRSGFDAEIGRRRIFKDVASAQRATGSEFEPHPDAP